MEGKQKTETKTAEDILNEYSDARFNMGMPFNYEALYQAMQAYADQEKRKAAIGILKFIKKKKLVKDDERGTWGECNPRKTINYLIAKTDEELYDLYLLSLTPVK